MHVAKAPSVGLFQAHRLGRAVGVPVVPGVLFQLGVIDHIIPEPLGGAQRDPRGMGNTLKAYLLRYLREVTQLGAEELLEQRYQKFRRMGAFEELVAADAR